MHRAQPSSPRLSVSRSIIAVRHDSAYAGLGTYKRRENGVLTRASKRAKKRNRHIKKHLDGTNDESFERSDVISSTILPCPPTWVSRSCRTYTTQRTVLKHYVPISEKNRGRDVDKSDLKSRQLFCFARSMMRTRFE